MPAAGWYRDPQDAAYEAFWDGAAWTPHRRPQSWDAPAPIPQWAPPPSLTPPPPPTPTRTRSRKRLLLAFVVVDILIAGLVTWLVWPGASAPKLTWDGRAIDAPQAVLQSAEGSVQTYVASRHGATNASTRCYFAQPTHPPTGTKRTDVDDKLRCGPVLFVDGDVAKAYLALGLTPALTNHGKQQLLAVSDLTGLQPDAVPSDLKLVRPDDKTAPSDTAGLAVPPPPAAADNTLVAAPLGKVLAPQHLDNAVIIGRNGGVTLDAAGAVPRYGSGDSARSVPNGFRLIAFRTSPHEGDLDSRGTATPQLVISGGLPRSLPAITSSDDWVIAAVPIAATAAVTFTDGGFTQTLSLPDGKPGDHNLAVLARTHRRATVNRKVDVPVRLVLNGSTVQHYSWHVSASDAHLIFWSSVNPSVHPADGAHALLFVDLVYTDPGLTTPNKVFGFHAANLSLTLPDGTSVKAVDADKRSDFVSNVFEVPADFTHGTLYINGQDQLADHYVENVVKRVGITVSILAG